MTRKQHTWTEDQIAFLADHATERRTELVAAFRAKFKKFEGSDQSVIGKRYNLVNRPSKKSPGLAQAATEARIAKLEAQLEQARADLEAMTTGTYWDKGETHTKDSLTALSMAGLRAAAKEAGVKANGSKADIAERIVAAA